MEETVKDNRTWMGWLQLFVHMEYNGYENAFEYKRCQVGSSL